MFLYFLLYFVSRDFTLFVVVCIVTTNLLPLFCRCKLEVLSSVVQMFRVIHLTGMQHNSEEGDSEAPSFDTLVALRLAIALMQARKFFHALIRNR